jgi:ABC-type transporter Mla maintaining outer membrane lipid asymmetry ATPase subunit MlaF
MVKRVSLARARALSSDLLILDEPTAGQNFFGGDRGKRALEHA